MWKFFLIRQNRSTNRASKFSFSKNSRGLKFQHFFMKKHRNTNLKFEFQNYFIFTPEKAHFWFLKKNAKTNFFLRVSALIQL